MNKNLRILGGISTLLILIFMAAALFQFEKEESTASPAPEQEFVYFFPDNWMMASLDITALSEADRKNPDNIQALIGDALTKGNCQEISLPYEGKSGTDTILVFKNTLQEIHAGLSLNFSSANALVYVFLDGKIIYQYGIRDASAPQILSESSQNSVSIPNSFENGELWIELLPIDPDAVVSFYDANIQAQETVIMGIFGNSITDIGCCLLIAIMSLILLVLALIRRCTFQPARGELFLGFMGLSAGLYYFLETNTLSMFYNIYGAYSIQEYLILLIPLFLALYFERNLYRIYPRRFFVLLLSAIGNVILQLFLQALQIGSIKNMSMLSAAVLELICLVTIISLIQLDYKNRRHEALLSVLSILVLLSGGITSIAINLFSEYSDGNTVEQYCMTVFILMMTAVHTLQISKEYRAAAVKSAKLLKEKVTLTEQQNTQLIQAKKEADDAKHEALAANEAKGKFLAHMSHEIRTPINAVLGMDEMILRESKEPPIKEYAMDIYMAGQTLLSLINDILDFSKIDSGKMELVPVEYDLSSLIHDLVTMTSQRAEHKNLCLEVEVDHEIPSRLYGDDVRIRQILTNILTNAVKYTQEGTVWLRVKKQKIEEDTVILHFEVEDTGIGIKEEDLPKLFAEFERIEENRNRNIEGTGLGMNITIQLLALLGSRLQVESVYGKGSKFYFDLKQNIIDSAAIGDFQFRVRQIAENYNYAVKFHAENAKILLTDDNAMNRKVFQNLLKETRIQITEAASGMDCLKLIQENHYDLIFLDHMMPEMDGIETLHRIQALPDCPCRNTPIIVLTANAVSGSKEAYLSEGFDDFLSKPIVPEKLESMIKAMLPEELLQEADNVQESTLPQTETTLPEVSLEDLPQIDGLDWDYARLHLPDRELLEYTIKEFYAQIDSAAEILQQFYEQIDSPEQQNQYRIQVHAMKSLAATIGIFPLAGIAKLLEYAARDGDIAAIHAMTIPFLKEWCSYRQKLQGIFGIGTVAKKEITDSSVLLGLLEMLKLCMQEMEIDQADQLLKELQAYHYPEEQNQTIQKLGQAVTNLNSEEAEQIVDLLMEQIQKESSSQ